jgi:hypothetical protein
MKEILYVISDVSGSMAESGKNHIMRNICLCIIQLRKYDPEKFKNVEFQFYKWNTIIEKVEVNKEDGFPLHMTEKHSDLEVLSVFLDESDVELLPLRILILTDGNFTNSELQKFEKRWIDNEKLLIRTVAVGADSNLQKLRRLSMGNKSYLSENITAALISVLHDSGKKVSRPLSLDNLMLYMAY